MPISNVVTWEDFTGGYWVGALDAAQPRNTWTGDNIWLDAHDGMVMPMVGTTAGLGDQAATAVTFTDVPALTANFTFPIRVPVLAAGDQPGVMVWAQQHSGTTWRWFRFNAQTVAVQKSATDFAAAAADWLTDAVPALGIHAASGTLRAWLPFDTTHISEFQINNLGHATVVVGAIGNRIARWNARMVSWTTDTPSAGTLGTNVLNFSNAADFEAWPTTNFYAIGDEQAIRTVVVTPGALLIGKRTGWWELTGVLGATVSIRQIGTASGPQVEPAHQVSQGEVIYDGYGQRVAFLSLQGLYPKVLNARMSQNRQRLSRVSTSGFLVGAVGLTDRLDNTAGIGGWIYDAVPRRWYRYQASSTFDTLRWAWDFDGNIPTPVLGDPNEPIVGVSTVSTDSQNRIVSFRDGLRTNGHVTDQPGRNVTATVTLAEHQSPAGSMERALEMWVEVVTPGSFASDAIFSCSIRLRAKGTADQPDVAPEPTTNPYVWERHSSQVGSNTRYMIRFTPDELPIATAFVPLITLKNLKLRRVLLGLSREQMGPV